MGGFFIAGNDGEWKSMGVVSEDGITLSASGATPIGLDHFTGDVADAYARQVMGSFTAAIEHVDEDAIRSFFDVPKISQGVGFELECRRKRRKDVLRERAEMVGGKFMRHYLRSQRISRRNSGTGKPADGGFVTRKVIFPDASIVPTDSGELVVSVHGLASQG